MQVCASAVNQMCVMCVALLSDVCPLRKSMPYMRCKKSGLCAILNDLHVMPSVIFWQ